MAFDENGNWIPDNQNTTNGYYVSDFGAPVVTNQGATTGVDATGASNIINASVPRDNLTGIAYFSRLLGDGWDTLTNKWNDFTKVQGTGANARSGLDTFTNLLSAGWNIYSGYQNMKMAKKYYADLQNNARAEYASSAGKTAADAGTHIAIADGWGNKELTNNLVNNYQGYINTAANAGDSIGADMSGLRAQSASLDKYKTLVG